MKRKKYTRGRAGWKDIIKKMKGADTMFELLEKDKRLPSFGEFFIVCLIMNNAECVNLKEMFPELHKDLSACLANRHP